jgi:DNA-binding transcriptional LysR family regulator
MREAEDAINRTRGAPRGRLKVSIPTVIGRRVVVPALPRFIDEYPDVELDISLDDRKVDIIEEGYDLAIRLGALNDSSLIARKLAPHRFVTCGAPGYLDTHGAPETPADLIDHRCILRAKRTV